MTITHLKPLSLIEIVFLATCLTLIDQASKHLAPIMENFTIFNLWSLMLHIHPNANFGMVYGIGSASEWTSIVHYSTLMLVVIFLIKYSTKLFSNFLSTIGSILLIAGAAGNGLDRFMYGHIQDFICISYGYIHFVFNLADLYLIVSVFLIGLTFKTQPSTV